MLIVIIVILWSGMIVGIPILIEVFVKLHLLCFSEISRSLSLLDDSPKQLILDKFECAIVSLDLVIRIKTVFPF